jgi:hypothetical protein
LSYNLNFEFVETKGINLPSQILCAHCESIPCIGETVVVHWMDYNAQSDGDFHRQTKGKVVDVIHSVYERDYDAKGYITVLLEPVT